MDKPHGGVYDLGKDANRTASMARFAIGEWLFAATRLWARAIPYEAATPLAALALDA